MKWSKPKQRMALKLQEIERARKGAIEARLAAARDVANEAAEARNAAEAAVDVSALSWEGHLSSQRFNPELGQILAAGLISRERDLQSRTETVRQADLRVSEQQSRWQKLEATVRSGEIALRSGRRLLMKSAEGRRDYEISDQTIWKWFRR